MSKRLIPALMLALMVAGASAAPAVTGASAHARALCARDDRSPAPRGMRPGAPASPLVPRGALLLTICDYNGMNATAHTPQFGLLGADRTRRAATIGRLTSELDALRPTRPGAPHSCPFDDASEALVRFYYGSAEVLVTVDTRGCGTIVSGPIRRLALGAPVIGQIEQLAKPVTGLGWATVIGHVRLCGGPYPGRCWTQPTGYPDASRVTAINSSGHWVAMAQLHRGRFRFTIATPGRYRFELMGSGQRSNTVLVRARATVRARRTTNVVLTIAVP